MSSSQDKKNRREASAELNAKKQQALLEEERKKKKTRLTYTIVGVLLVLFVAFTVVMNSNLFYTGMAAVRSGDDSYTAAEYEYTYLTGFNNFYSRNASYISWLMDVTVPLDEQDCAMLEEGTWADYFQDGALSNLQTISAQYKAAVDAGYTLSEEDGKVIDDFIEEYRVYGESYGYSLDKFLAVNFGRGVDEAVVRGLMEKSLVASAYAQDQYDSYSYTDSELEDYYRENAESYDTLEYSYVFVDGTVPEEEEEDDIRVGEPDAPAESVEPEQSPEEENAEPEQPSEEESARAMEEARLTAEALAESEDLESFAALALELTGVELTEMSSLIANVPLVYADWLNDAARAEGDMTAVEAETGYYVLYFMGRNDNHYNTVNVRHILINVEDTDSDGELSEEERGAALAEIEALHEEWKAGEATEESFAALANEHSDDGGSNTTGGLYENVARGDMVEPFEEFCFAGHEPGDTEIVFSEAANYTGYHLIYFVGEGELYSNLLADNALREAAYAEWNAALIEPYAPTTSSLPLRLANQEMVAMIHSMLNR